MCELSNLDNKMVHNISETVKLENIVRSTPLTEGII